MAVEIPVVIDINGAFKRAIDQVGPALDDVQKIIEKNQIDLFPHIEENLKKLDMAKARVSELSTALKGIMGKNEMNMFTPFDTEQVSRVTKALMDAQIGLNRVGNIGQFAEGLSKADFELLQMREHYRALEESSRRLSTSINGYRERLSDLNEQWSRLTTAEKYASDGKMTAEAQKIYDKFRQETLELQKQGQTLDQLFSKEQRRLELISRVAQKRKYEDAILKANSKSMRVLQEQDRILSDRLNRTTIGSSKYNQLKTQLQGVREEIKKINADINGSTNPALDKTNSRLGMLIKNSVRLIALHTGVRFVKNIREVTSEFELQRVALGSIIQDTERANQLFRQIKTAAIESPFEIKDLVSYTKQLSAYQIETDKLFDTTMKLADVSAGLGVDMGRLILAYGQVRAAAVLRGQELRQFTEAGIPLVDKLAEKFSQLRGEMVSTGEVFQLISERAVPFRMIEEIFDDMTSAGGMFYKMQEKQAKTLAGQWANLKDSFSIMYDEIGNTKEVHDFMEGLISTVKDAVRNWRTWSDILTVVGATLLSYYGTAKLAAAATKLLAVSESEASAAQILREKNTKRIISSIIGKTAAERISTIATDLHAKAMDKATAATTVLSKAFWKLTVALLSNPFGIIAASVAGLIALFATLSNKTRDVNADIETMDASIKSLNRARGETEKLIDSYEELSKKTSLTTDESKKLKAIASELAILFPKASKGIDENTNALTLNIAKLRSYNEEAKKATERGIRAQMSVDEKTIQKNQDKINKINKKINRGTAYNPITLLNPVRLKLSEEQLKELNDEANKLANDNLKLAESIKNAQEALDGMKNTGDKTVSSMTSWQEKIIGFSRDVNGAVIHVLDPDQIKQYSSLDAALEDIAKKYKEYDEQVKILTAALKDKNEEEAKDLQLALARAIARKELTKEALDYYNAFFLTQKKSHGGSHQKDPFITRIEERIKFMQDFKKGYDDLRKYMTSSEALGIEGRIMEGRGLSIGLDPSEQKMAAKDLSAWYTKMIQTVGNELKKKGIKGNTVTELLGVDTAKKSKAIQDLQKLLQSLWDAKTDFDTDQKKKELEDALKNLSDEIKRSETVRDFFNDIFDATGDKEIATKMTMSVYGDIGQDLEKKLQEQLSKAFVLDEDKLKKNEISLAQANADIATAIINEDYVLLSDYLNYVTDANKDNAKELLADRMKANADWLKDFQNTYKKSRTYQERVDTLNQQRTKAKDEAKSRKLGESDMNAIDKYYDEKIADVQLEALKDTYEWVKAFEDLENVSTETLNNLIVLLDEYITKYGKTASPESLKAVVQARDQAKDQITVRNAYIETAAAFKQYLTARKKASSLEKNGKKNTQEYVKAQDAARAALKKMDKGLQAISDSFNTISSVVSSVSDLLSFDDMSDGKAILDGIAKGLALVGAALTFVSAIMTAIEANPIVLAISSVVAAVASLSSVISNLKTAKIDREIKHQQELIEDLEYSYGRLENAIAKAFGSDYIYNYNQQLENLMAKQAAYEEQARLESDKGKKKDAEKIKEYENAARDVQDQIAEMKSQLSEFFTGTDVTSAAEDFANAWIDAYKEFGSTTDAMKEKFSDMVQNMVQKSIAAKLMEEILAPLFKQIDEMAQSDAMLTADEIAQIGEQAPVYIDKINEAMTGLMNQLGATGYNMRQQVGGFTGISRNIAGATEESINGLAAGINTQNFYISNINQNVATILSLLSGGSVSPVTVGGPSAEVPDPYKDNMLLYASSIPIMRDDMSAIRSMLDKVVKPAGVKATHYISTNA